MFPVENSVFEIKESRNAQHEGWYDEMIYPLWICSLKTVYEFCELVFNIYDSTFEENAKSLVVQAGLHCNCKSPLGTFCLRYTISSEHPPHLQDFTLYNFLVLPELQMVLLW